MREAPLPFSAPFLGEEEINEVIATLRSDWITTGPKVKSFEEEFAARVGSPAAVALNSGTAALHTGLAALGVGPGDAVVTTTMTFCSSVHVIEHLGARPILVDVEPDTLNIDPDQLSDKVHAMRRGDERVRAVMPVHLYGHPCDMDPILDLARRHNLVVVQDAAHALAAGYKGNPIGSKALADGNPRVVACFSFYATKNLTTAEGGMLAGDTQVLDEARIWSLNGMSRDAYKRYSSEGSWYYEVIRPGFKHNMTDIQAGIGLHQLNKLSQFQARRHAIADRYSEAFAALPELQTPADSPEVEHAWHLYVVRLVEDRLKLNRNSFIEELRARNIGTSVHFIPIHLHAYYRDKYGYQPTDFPVAYREYQRIVSLPLYPRMSDGDVEDVIDAVTDVIQRHRA